MGKRILTNKNNLPDTLVKAVAYDTHKMAGSLSVTQLIDGAQVRYLKSCYDYEVDVIDSIYALLGTALHNVLERANIDSHRKRAFLLTAETLAMKAQEYTKTAPDKASMLDKGSKWLFSLIPVFFPEVNEKYIFEKTMSLDMGDHVISGTFDLYDKETGILYDYKLCSTFQWMNPSAREKWHEQLNIYAYMLQKEGFPVNGIRVVAFFRDWSAAGMMRSSNYPNTQIKEIHIPLWSTEQTWNLINFHLDQHRQAELGNVPQCSGKIRWATADTFAVLQHGMKRSVKNFDTHAAAQDFINKNQHKFTKNLSVQVRPGQSMRCQNYCPVSKFCPQYQAELKKDQEVSY